MLLLACTQNVTLNAESEPVLLLACSWGTTWVCMHQVTCTRVTTGVWGTTCCWHMQLLCSASGTSCLMGASA